MVTNQPGNNRLRRITSGGKFIPQIDGLRFIAIASVLCFHTFENFQSAGLISPDLGHYLLAQLAPKRGVELFFVISGFILGLPFAKMRIHSGEKVRLGSYFIRRVTRLEPPYMLMLALRTAAMVLSGAVAFRLILPHLLSTVFYSHNLLFRGPNPINGVIWSLEVEIQFYCLVPVLSFVFSIRNAMRRRLILLFAIAAWSTATVPLRSIWLNQSILYYLPFFLAGFLLADLYLAQAFVRGREHWKWDLLAVACWPLVWLLPLAVEHIALPLLFLALFATAFRGRFFSRAMSIPAVTNIGGMCYSIYLLHTLFIPRLTKIAARLGAGRLGGLGAAMEFAAVVSATLLLCTVYFVLIERPCMARDWPQRLWSRVSRVPGAEAAVAELRE